MNPDTGIKTWQWVVTIIVIIVLIVIGVMVFGNKGAKAPVDTSAPVTDTTGQGSNSIVMSDQYPGNVVYLSSVQLQKAGWVEIHKDNAGQPGAYIGSAFVQSGINPVKITLTEPVIDGGTYYAMLHSDNGDQKFDATVDLPLKDASGNIIMRVFHGSVTAGNNVKG
ncbi:MAG: hypothetical protein JWO00_370 [Candidatus Parcubacteria bacterium]|nr:hypothetical protein [Candidatus Parcubacteria bacterium]